MRSMLICASLALPFQMRQRKRSTSVMIIAFAAPRAGSRPTARRRLASGIDADLRVFGLAVPDAPAQSLDLRDDHRLRHPSRWVLVRQHAGDLLQVLQPHG